MKIVFKDSELDKGLINVSLDGGFTYKDYEITDVKETGIPLDDSQDYEKIKIKGPANILKRLDVISTIPSNDDETTEELNFIIDTDTYGFSFPECVVGVILPDGITSISNSSISFDSSIEDVFSIFSFPNLKSIIIPDSVTSIGDGAFALCSSLTSITIPNSVTSIGFGAFVCCSSLTSIDIPDSVTSMGEGAFTGCSSLTSVAIQEGVTSISYCAFESCTSLTNVTIPNSVTSIGWGAFENCSSLTSINIPDSVTSIGSYAFGGCTNLTSVTIHNGVTSISDEAFYNCSKLTSINYTGTKEQWNLISKGPDWDKLCPSDMVINYNYQG